MKLLLVTASLRTLILVSILPVLSIAQEQKLVDSLQQQLKNHNKRKLELGKNATPLFDSSAATILNSLSEAYWYSDPQKSFNYANQCLVLSENIGYKKGVSNAYNSLGKIKNLKGDFIPALELYKKSLAIRKTINDKIGISESFLNIGFIYFRQGNYPLAMKNYFIALKIAEENNNKRGIADSYSSLGNIYSNQGNYNEGLKNYSKGLIIEKEIGDKSRIAATYINIGSTHMFQGNYDEAMQNQLSALAIGNELEDKQTIAYSHYNIGDIYGFQNNIKEALSHYFICLKIFEELNDKYLLSHIYNDIGDAYTREKKFIEAANYLNKGFLLSRETGSLESIKESYQSLANLDSAQGNFKKALINYKRYIAVRDSLVNNANIEKTTQQQMQYDFDKKESLALAEQEKKDALAQKEMQKQKLVRNAFIAGTILFLLLAATIFIGLKKTATAKKKSDELLLNILPPEVASELKLTGSCKPKSFDKITVMFADFKDFTLIGEKISAELLVGELNYCFSGFDKILQKYKIEKIKTVGDAYLCASGLPSLNHSQALDMVAAAIEMKEFVLKRYNEKRGLNEVAFQLRIGINTGPVVAGIVGIKKFSYDIWGDTVNIAARMEECCEPGHINISGSTYELVKDKFNCTYRGKILAKNKGEIDMYFVSDAV